MIEDLGSGKPASVVEHPEDNVLVTAREDPELPLSHQARARARLSSFMVPSISTFSGQFFRRITPLFNMERNRSVLPARLRPQKRRRGHSLVDQLPYAVSGEVGDKGVVVHS